MAYSDATAEQIQLGEQGENVIVTKLLSTNFFEDGFIIRNIFGIRPNDADIDIIAVTSKGIFVFESKNWKGKVYTSIERSSTTMVVDGIMFNRLKSNPIKSIKNSMLYLKWFFSNSNYQLQDKVFGYLVFSDRTDAVNLNGYTGAKVCKWHDLVEKFTEQYNQLPDVFNNETINAIRQSFETDRVKYRLVKELPKSIREIPIQTKSTNIIDIAVQKLALLKEELALKMEELEDLKAETEYIISEINAEANDDMEALRNQYAETDYDKDISVYDLERLSREFEKEKHTIEQKVKKDIHSVKLQSNKMQQALLEEINSINEKINNQTS